MILRGGTEQIAQDCVNSLADAYEQKVICFNHEQNTKKDIIILAVLYVITILLSVFTYNGLPSLFSVLGTFLYTYSVWQKNTNTYKLLGIPTSISWIAYNIYIKSIFGGILESIVLICSGIGYLLAKKKTSKQGEEESNIQK